MQEKAWGRLSNSLLSNSLLKEKFVENKIALLVIDMQYDLTAQGYGVLKYVKELGISEGYEYYYDRIKNDIIPNIQELLTRFRKNKSTVIFSKIRPHSIKYNNDEIEDTSLEGGVILKEVEPMADEKVITKNGQNIFENTGLDPFLREREIDTLIVVGVLTNECIESSVMDAVRKNYNVIVAEDSTAAFSEDLHNHSLDNLDDMAMSIASTKKIINVLGNSI